MKDVACLGIMVADAFGHPIDTIPEKARLKLFDRMELHTGGCALNTSIALAKMGFTALVLGKVGMDSFGEFLVREAEEHGVDTRGVTRDGKVSTSFTFVMVASDGERRFLHTLGANATLRLEDVDMEVVREAGILHMAGTFLMPSLDGEATARILEQARASGLKTSMDTAYNDRLEDWLGTVSPSMPHLDYFLPSIEEAERISGRKDPREMARFFRDLGCRNVGIKLGREGCYIQGEGEEALLPIHPVETVDSSGAGDCWVAGFLAGLIKGRSLVDAARLGNAAAALCVQAVGCTEGVRPFDEVVAFRKGRSP